MTVKRLAFNKLSARTLALGVVLLGLFWLGTFFILNRQPAEASSLPANILKQVDFTQRLNAQVPLNLAFQDSTGQTIQLSDYFGRHPVILALGYYQCPNLCYLVRQGLAKSLSQISLQAGKDFEVVFASIDPTETPPTAADEKTWFVQQYGRTTDGIHYLTGTQQPITQLTHSVGFQYAIDAEHRQFAHPSGIVLLTPQGKVSRYFYGVDFPSQDVRLGLVEASANQIGSVVDQVLLRCYHYDPLTGRYSMVVINVVQVVSSLTAILLGGLVLLLLRSERLKQQPRSE